MSHTAFFAYGVVTMDEEILFMDSAQLDNTAWQNLDHSLSLTMPFLGISTANHAFWSWVGHRFVLLHHHLSCNYITIVSSLENPVRRQQA